MRSGIKHFSSKNSHVLLIFNFQPSLTDFAITGLPNGFPMSRLEKLERLELNTDTSNLTDDSFKHFESMSNLTQVIISESNIRRLELHYGLSVYDISDKLEILRNPDRILRQSGKVTVILPSKKEWREHLQYVP